MVLDSQISILNFVNWNKASFMEKLNFPDIKPVPRGRGRMLGGISTHAKSFNIFVLLTCALDGRNICESIKKLKDKVGFMSGKNTC